MDYAKNLIELFTEVDLKLLGPYKKWLGNTIKHYKSATEKL